MVHKREAGLSGQDFRVETRAKALIRAGLRWDDEIREACILDASTRGLLMTAAMPPPRGAFVEVLVGHHVAIGHVKWSSTRRFGIALRDRISVVALLSGESAPISLARQDMQRKNRLLRNEGTVRIAGAMRIAGVLAALGVAAVTFAGYASEGLGELQVARKAMAGASG